MKYRVLQSEQVWGGFLKLHRYRLQHECFAGGWCPELVRERVEGNHAVSVLLYDPVQDAVVLIEQFRIGALGHQEPPWLLETVGGYVEKGEALEAVAIRETREETGCDVSRLELVGTFFTTPGWCGERITLYCGLVDSRGAEGVHGLAHEGEDIRVVVMPAGEALGELFRKANSTSIVVGLQWLALNRERLRAEWS
ncbi:MAG: ADP-ribose pyrophosphatase [Gammaproteobacteria bacterium]|nr:MAG: ADP-ribose pyrophosphatase [Gammaproteobacteria bacterium]